MSYWTYVNGVINVDVSGRTQPESRYILETVLSHLPKVTGSEGNMNVYIIQKAGHNISASHNEFSVREEECFYVQSEYILVVDGNLRDRMFEDTFKEFNNFINRLAKRLEVLSILVSVKGYDKEYTFQDSEAYYDMYEWPSWCNDTGEPAWWEYLMWDRGIDTELPMALEYKYSINPKNDIEWERRQKAMRGNRYGRN